MVTGTFFTEIIHWLDQNEWKYESREKAGIIEMNMSLRCELKKCQVIAWMREEECIVMGRIPIRVEKEARGRIAEYLCRINYGLYSGYFDFNYDDGEIRFKTFLQDSTDAARKQENIGQALMRPAMMFDMYGPSLLKVLRQEQEPGEAVENE